MMKSISMFEDYLEVNLVYTIIACALTNIKILLPINMKCAITFVFKNTCVHTFFAQRPAPNILIIFSVAIMVALNQTVTIQY